MRNIATIPAHDREALFHNTAAKMSMQTVLELERMHFKYSVCLIKRQSQ